MNSRSRLLSMSLSVVALVGCRVQGPPRCCPGLAPPSTPDDGQLVELMGWQRGETGSDEARARAAALLRQRSIFSSVDFSFGWTLSVPPARVPEARRLLEGDELVRPFVIDPRTGRTYGGSKGFGEVRHGDPLNEPSERVLSWHHAVGGDETYPKAAKILEAKGIRMYVANPGYETWIFVPRTRAEEARQLLAGDPALGRFVTDANGSLGAHDK